jgi:hypothetical protein
VPAMPHTVPVRKAAAVGVLTFAVVSCGSPSPSAATGNGLGFTAAQLCKLATTAEVGSALGRSVPDGVPSGVNAPACVWTASDGSGATIAATDTASVGKLPYGLQGMSGAAVTAVPNLGDAAFFASAGTLPDAELDMKKGGRAVTITAAVAGGTMTLAEQESIEKAIATAAAGRM